jgi:hypothetical protein
MHACNNGNLFSEKVETEMGTPYLTVLPGGHIHNYQQQSILQADRMKAEFKTHVFIYGFV